MGNWREQLASWRLPITDFPVVPEESALVVVDMQYTDAHPDYGLGKVFATVDPSRAQYYFSRLRDTVIPNIRRLLEAFRAEELRVIYLTLGPVLADGSDLSPNSAAGIGSKNGPSASASPTRWGPRVTACSMRSRPGPANL